MTRTLPLFALAIAACFVEVPSSRPGGDGGGMPAGGSGGSGAAATGPGGGGQGGCAAGTADCDGDGSCETDTHNDNTNCGACARDCLGASCAVGLCQPVIVRGQQTHPYQVVVDDDYVFWTVGGVDTGAGKVMRCNKNGSAPRTLVDSATKPRGIALDGDFVYWSDGAEGSLHRVRKDTTGGDEVLADPMMLTSHADTGLWLADGRAYWTHKEAGEVYAADLDGNNFATLASAQPEPRQIVVFDGFAYFSAGPAPEVRRVPIGGGAVESFASPDPPYETVAFAWGLAVADGAVFFRETDWGSGLEGRLMRLDPSSGDIVQVVQSPGARGLTSDGADLFWTGNEDNTISRADLAGENPQVVATGQATPNGIAVDDEAIYWTNRSDGNPQAGSIFKVAK